MRKLTVLCKRFLTIKKKRLDETSPLETAFHKLSLEALANHFGVSLESGLASQTALNLLNKHGKNKLKQNKQNPVIKLASYFVSGFCGLLWVAALICILAWKPIGDPADPLNLGLGLMLILVILLQAAFTAFQDWSANKVMRSIRNMMPSTAIVIRNGLDMSVSVEELVPGDLVKLSCGNKVPADIRIISNNNLRFDRSMLTGESEQVDGAVECTDLRYIETKNMAFMTTLITNGQGKGVVVATGDRTMMGSINRLVNTASKKKSSLKKELNRFVLIIALSAIVLAVITVVTWAVWLRTSHPNYINVATMLVTTISVMVAIIPEGLPVCVTLALLLIAKRMSKHRVLVKELSTIETLSLVNVIASDKTGTLTQNKMHVSSAAVGLVELEMHRLGEFRRDINSNIGFNELIACCGLCNNARFIETSNVSEISKQAEGDATDIALLRFSVNYKQFSDLNRNYNILCEIPFNSKNKWMLKVVKSEDALLHRLNFGMQMDANKEMMLLKGAPDYLLKKCNKIIDINGEEQELTSQHLLDIIKMQNEWCMRGQRVLLLCRRAIGSDETVSYANSLDIEQLVADSNDFCIVGMIGLIDPPREGIRDVVTKCREAGIRVFMVTGDFSVTAVAIANQIGLFNLAGKLRKSFRDFCC